MVTTIPGAGGRANKFPLSYLPTDKEITKKAVLSYMLINEGMGEFNKETTVNTVTYWVQNTVGVEQKSFPIISEWHLGAYKGIFVQH